MKGWVLGRETMRGCVGRETKCFVSAASNMEVVCNHVGVLCTTLKLELVPFYVSITSLSTGLSN